MNERKFIKNAALLTGTGLVLRAAGLLLRVLVAGVLGEEGMGLYSLTFTVFTLFVTLAQSGIGVAATRLVAQHLALKNPARAKGAFRACLLWALALGGGAALLLYAGSGFLAERWIGSVSCAPALRVLALSLPAIAAAGCFSGYFMALREVLPGCAAQTAEQAVRLGIVAAVVFLFRSAPTARLLGAIVAANTISEAVSCLMLGVSYRKRRLHGAAMRPQAGSIRRIALPVAASRYLACGLHSTENMLIPAAIARYAGSYTVGLAQFGALRGMAIPLLFFPASFLSALSSLLVPEVTDTAARADRRATRALTARAVGITVTLSVMIGALFFLYGDLLGQVLFHSESVSLMLRVLAPITPFMYLDTIADGLLKGLDQQKKTLRNNTVDSVLRILLIALLVPYFGIYGYLGVMLVSNVLVASLNLGTLLSACGLPFQKKSWLFRPLAAAGTATAVWALLPLRGSVVKMAIGAALWCGVYLLFFRLTLPEKAFIIEKSVKGGVRREKRAFE